MPETPTIDTRSRAVATRTLWGSNCPEDGIGEWVLDLDVVRRPDEYELVDESSSGVAWMEPVVDPLPRRWADHRSGLCFDVESTEMRAACVDSIREMIGGDEVIHEARHQKKGYHTDLVVAEIDADGVAERRAVVSGNDPIHDPLQRFKVWWDLVEYGPTNRSEAIEKGTYADDAKNRKHIDWLLSHGYVASTQIGTLVGVRPPSIADLHAVELKLRNWEKALEQATRARRCDVNDNYRDTMHAELFDRYGYADYAWVALDAGAIGPALDHEATFRDAGVGLLAVTEGGTVIKHIDAEYRPRNRYTRDRAYIESQLWARIDVDDHRTDTDVGGEPRATEAGEQVTLAAHGGRIDE